MTDRQSREAPSGAGRRPDLDGTSARAIMPPTSWQGCAARRCPPRAESPGVRSAGGRSRRRYGASTTERRRASLSEVAVAVVSPQWARPPLSGSQPLAASPLVPRDTNGAACAEGHRPSWAIARARRRRPWWWPASRSERVAGEASGRGSRRPGIGPRRACRRMQGARERRQTPVRAYANHQVRRQLGRRRRGAPRCLSVGSALMSASGPGGERQSDRECPCGDDAGVERNPPKSPVGIDFARSRPAVVWSRRLSAYASLRRAGVRERTSHRRRLGASAMAASTANCVARAQRWRAAPIGKAIWRVRVDRRRMVAGGT